MQFSYRNDKKVCAPSNFPVSTHFILENVPRSPILTCAIYQVGKIQLLTMHVSNPLDKIATNNLSQAISLQGTQKQREIPNIPCLLCVLFWFSSSRVGFQTCFALCTSCLIFKRGPRRQISPWLPQHSEHAQSSSTNLERDTDKFHHGNDNTDTFSIPLQACSV